MGKTLMDGKSKQERPSQSESFESFRAIKMYFNGNGNRHSSARSPRIPPPDSLPLQIRRPCQSPDAESIGEAEEDEETSIQSDPHILQSNRRVVPSAPPRSKMPQSLEPGHPTEDTTILPTCRQPGGSPLHPHKYHQQKERFASSPPKSPPPPLSPPPLQSPGKMQEFVNDSRGFMSELQVSGQFDKVDWFTSVLTVLSMVIVALTFPFSMIFCLKTVAEYERAVVLRMGRLLPGGQGTRGPGLFFVLPCIDNVRTVELRTVTFSIPPQEVLTRDSVTVAVDAVVYYRICNPALSILNVEDAARSTRLLAQTTLRNVLGTKDLAQILMDREEMSVTMQSTIDTATEAWGVKVERVEIKDVRLPVALQRAMAAEAEATREARAKVIAANGEHKASRALKEAARVISASPLALQLRYLQTMCAISAEKNSTIIFPLPIDILSGFSCGSFGGSASGVHDTSSQGQKSAMVRKWLPTVGDQHISSSPNPRALLPGMGEADPKIPQPIPPTLPEKQRRQYETAALLTAAGASRNAAQGPDSLLRSPTDEFDDTCSDSV